MKIVDVVGFYLVAQRTTPSSSVVRRDAHLRNLDIDRGPRSRLLAIALILACSALNAPGQPAELRSSDEASDSIGYRMLERADYKGTSPPPLAVGRGNHALAATTCIDVRTDPSFSMQIGSITAADGTDKFEGWLSHARFRALMDRDCSWWSANVRDPEYTLQHEQIHFAIREIEVRRLNQSAEGLSTALHVTADSEQEVQRMIRQRVEQLFNEHSEAALQTSREFDNDTSGTPNEERQRQWWLQIERELAETAGWR
jgi:hypothetical protein